MTGASTTEIYYDPFDFEIDDNPYPIWKRMRDEAPLYHNEKYNFYALSRYEDVAPQLTNWETYRSGHGTTMDIIMSGIQVPPGVILFEDPPLHDLHRRLLSRVFTPRRMEAIEPLTRDFCVRALDPWVGSGRFDFIENLGSMIPMRTIGYLLGIPEENQANIRDRGGRAINLTEGTFRAVDDDLFEKSYEVFSDYIDWRTEHPSDDLITQLLNAEVEDNGVTRRLDRTEVLMYTSMIAGAGNETTTRLIGFIGQLLAEHPDQRREIVRNPSLIPKAIEEVLRYEAPSPVQARHVAHDVECYGTVILEGSIMLLLNGSANRDERRYPRGEEFDIHR
ncbi:MAG: cytochrome P450, partial [Mycobacteriaceae bacterium]|nr:cytochrome P450 [Mycobacteriaceae bacterium]